MTPAKPNSLIRWMPSLTDLAFLMPLLFMFTKMDGIRTMLGDGDTGWHIRIGEWILANGRVPRADFFSFTMPNAPFYAWEWLWDLLAALVYRHGGLAMVVVANMLLLGVIFALLFRLVMRKCGNPLIAIAVTWLATATSTVHWLARPHLVTLLFTVIFLGRLERIREPEGLTTELDSNWRPLIWLPILTIVWTNLHGGFFVGTLLLACYAVGEALTGLVAGKGIPRKAYWFGWTGLACMAASLVNPYGYLLHKHLIEFFSEPYHMEAINEFRSISFHPAAARYFEILMMLGLAAAFWNLTRKQFYAVFLLAGWAHLALLAGRNIAIFAVVAAPFVAEGLDQLVSTLASRLDLAGRLRGAARGLQEFGAELRQIDILPRVHAACVLAIVLIALAARVPDPPKMLRSDYDPARYPAGAVERLRGPEFSHSIFTHDEWGDYLIYRMYPETKVFVDGRTDFYGGKFGRKYLDVMDVKWDWESDLLQYGVDTILLPPDSELAGALKESARWCLVYDDTVSLIFRHRNVRSCADEQSAFDAKSGAGKSVVARSHDSEVKPGRTEQ